MRILRIEGFRSESTIGVEEAAPGGGDLGGDENTSRALEIIETAWGQMREIIPELPQAVLLVLSATEYSRRGHFRMDSWRRKHHPGLLHEVAVHPGMFGAPSDLLVTMLHESAHAILWEKRENGDRHCCGVSLAGYYHRVEFRTAARKLGLEVGFRNRRYGFSQTNWPPSGVPAKYREIIGTLGALNIMASLSLPPRVAIEVKKAPADSRRLGCRCRPTRVLFVSIAQQRRGPILCGECCCAFLPGL